MFQHLLHTNMRFFLSILMLHTKKCNMAEPMLHTKIWYLSVSALFFYISKCVMSFSVLETDHLIFSGGKGGLGFFLKIFLLFSSDRKPENFVFTVWEPKYFFQDKAKTKYFF